jgi:metal-responsive CopG/Arc/MetJ family transcriptional regulator
MRNKVQLSISVDKEVMEAIMSEKKETRVSRSVIVNDILRNYYESDLKSATVKGTSDE